MSESGVPGPLPCNCSLGALWRNVRAVISPSPRAGKTGRRWGSTHSTDKRFCRALLSSVQVLRLSTAPHRPPSHLLASDAPFPRGQAPGPGWSCNRCPHLSLRTSTGNAPPTPHHKHPRRLPPSPSIVFKEISGSHQTHPNAPPFAGAPISLSLRGPAASAGLKGGSEGVTRKNLASQTHRVHLARMPVTCRLQ